MVAALDGAGVPVIEVTHGDGLGGSSFTYGISATAERDLIKVAAETGTQAKIAVLMLPGVGAQGGHPRGARPRCRHLPDRHALHRGRHRRSSTSRSPASWASRPWGS